MPLIDERKERKRLDTFVRVLDATVESDVITDEVGYYAFMWMRFDISQSIRFLKKLISTADAEEAKQATAIVIELETLEERYMLRRQAYESTTT